jgi:hypothetical protein
MHLKILAAITFVTLFSACSQSSSLDLKEGKWSIETSTEIAGMPMAMPPVTVTQCLTEEDAVPTQRSQEGNPCTITDQRINGSTLTWKVECPNSVGSGTMTYNHDTFFGKMTMEANTPGGTMNMVSTMKGHYLGPCQQ